MQLTISFYVNLKELYPEPFTLIHDRFEIIKAGSDACNRVGRLPYATAPDCFKKSLLFCMAKFWQVEGEIVSKQI